MDVRKKIDESIKHKKTSPVGYYNNLTVAHNNMYE